jgi:hypothetical protein
LTGGVGFWLTRLVNVLNLRITDKAIGFSLWSIREQILILA